MSRPSVIKSIWFVVRQQPYLGTILNLKVLKAHFLGRKMLESQSRQKNYLKTIQNVGLAVMFDREFSFLNRLLVEPLISRFSIVLASAIFIVTLSSLQSAIIIATPQICYKNIFNEGF